MRLVMTSAELEKALREYRTDDSGDALEIIEDPKAPSGHSALVSLNHWQMRLPIEVETVNR